MAPFRDFRINAFDPGPLVEEMASRGATMASPSDSVINAYKFNETSNVRLQTEFLPVANG
jgi:hypothetical protein